MPQTIVPQMRWRLVVKQTPIAFIHVEFLEQAGWLAHPARSEMPVVSGIERGPAQQEHGYFGSPSPIRELRLETVRLPFWLCQELLHDTLGPGSSVIDLAVEGLF